LITEQKYTSREQLIIMRITERHYPLGRSQNSKESKLCTIKSTLNISEIAEPVILSSE